MSEKRFIFVDNIFKYLETGIKDNKSEYDSLNGESVVDLLNELVEENKQLRQFINKGRRLSVKELMDNANENELLKKKIRGLEKENEQLKMRLLNCEQKNNDNGGFQVWEVPPIPQGERISFITKYGGDGL